MANEAFETERARIRGESPKSVLGISPAERWGSAAGALASALIAQRLGKSPIAAGVSAYGGGIKGAIGRRADELSAQYKQSQMQNEQDRMAAGLVKPSYSTRREGDEVVTQEYTTAGGRKDIGRGSAYSPTAKVGGGSKLSASNQKLARDSYYARVVNVLGVDLDEISSINPVDGSVQINDAMLKSFLSKMPDRQLAQKILKGESAVINALNSGSGALEAGEKGASFITGQPTRTGAGSLSREDAMKMIQQNPGDF